MARSELCVGIQHPKNEPNPTLALPVAPLPMGGFKPLNPTLGSPYLPGTPKLLAVCAHPAAPACGGRNDSLPPLCSPRHHCFGTAEGSHLLPPSPWGSLSAPPWGTGALWGQVPSRKETLRSTPQTFPATLAWPSRGLYLDLQEEKPGERRLVTFKPCLQLPSSGWEGGSETGCPSHPPPSPLILVAGPWPPRVWWLLAPSSLCPACAFVGTFTPRPGLFSRHGGSGGCLQP